jgi:hypothetical protein
MSNTYSVDDVLGFLDHAAEKGLMPPATATALSVACRNVLGVLSDEERQNLSGQDLNSVIRRFQNKRARDFTAPTLKEYARRVHRAVNLFLEWRNDPANFRAPTRATSSTRKRKNDSEPEVEPELPLTQVGAAPQVLPGTYQTAVPLSRDRIVTLLNVPADLTKAEAKRLAAFVEMLSVESPG